MDRAQGYLENILKVRDHDSKALRAVARAKALLESDSRFARVGVSLAIAVASAFTGMASVAGVAAAFVERETIYALAVVITTSLISAVSSYLASGRIRSHAASKRRLKMIREELKSAYWTDIRNSGLCQQEIISDGARSATV